MKKLIKAISVFSVIVALFITITAGAADGNAYSWYCVHRNDRLQPKSDSAFDFIDKYGGYYIDKNHGDDNSDKVIYLTFDAGYENGNIEKILDILKRQEVSSAFFILGNMINKEQSLVTRMFDEGHLVCNHTYTHKTMVSKSADEFQNELLMLENTCKEVLGREIAKYYRPPEGRFDEESLKYASEMGYKTIFWSFAYADWDNNHQMSREKAKEKILKNVHNGEIMLLHPTSATNAAILEEIIISLKADGYRFGTLDELCSS